jgi:hypothetical protein
MSQAYKIEPYAPELAEISSLRPVEVKAQFRAKIDFGAGPADAVELHVVVEAAHRAEAAEKVTQALARFRREVALEDYATVS